MKHLMCFLGLLLSSACVFAEEVESSTLPSNSEQINSTYNASLLPDHILLNEESLALLVNISENLISSAGEASPETDLETWVAPYKIRKNYPYYLSGYDLEDRPIFVAEIGRWNLRAIVNEGGSILKDFDKYVQQSAYRVLKAIKDKSTPDNPIDGAIFIADFDELNLVQMAHIPTVSYVIHLAQEYRGLILKHMHAGFAVNTNFVAEQLINLIRPVFGEILSKIEIYGTNPTKWKPNIVRTVGNRQSIPDWYGGSSKNFKPVAVFG